ncbi:MAG: autotransporter-associated beta strand repeat-containing protein [Verrucomicrobia bacterium]|nr:autotransporter-associated beta strand repeat-containing protein [Verrucomicrobiota bacterium]
MNIEYIGGPWPRGHWPRRLFTVFLALGIMAGAVRAQFYWDTSGSTAGAGGSTPSGTWSTSAANWSSSSAGTAATAAWSGSSNDAVFAAGTDATGAYTVTVSGSVSVNDITFAEGTVTIAGSTLTLARPSSSDNPTITVSAESATISAVLGSTFALTKAGSGALVLSGNNTFSGSMTVSQGVLNLQHNSALGTTAGSTTVSSGAAVELQGVSGGTAIVIGNEALSLSGTGVSGGGALRSVAGSNSWAGAITLAANASIVAELDSLTLSGNLNGSSSGRVLTFGGGGNTTVSGAIGGNVGNLVKTGSGTLALTATNSYTGTTTINAGTVSINSDRSLGAVPGSVISNEVVLDGGALAATANLTLSGNRGITIGAGGGALDVATGATLTYPGVLDGSGSLTKTGGGILSLTGGAANTLSGPTQVANGTLSLGKTASLDALASAQISVGDGTGAAGSAVLALAANNQIPNAALVTVASDGNFNVGAFTDTINQVGGLGLITIASGGTLTVGGTNGSSSFGGTLTGLGTLEKAGSGTLTFTQSFSLAGTLTLSGGTVALSNVDLTVGTLRITGNSILDFGAGASSLTATNLIIDPGVILTVANWTHLQDFFRVTTSFTQSGGPAAAREVSGVAPQNQIVFSGYSSDDTQWYSAANGNQLAPFPAPEPPVYGLGMAGLAAGLVAWRRRSGRGAG